MAADRHSGQIGKDLIHPDKSRIAIDKGQADRRVREHRIEKGERVVSPARCSASEATMRLKVSIGSPIVMHDHGREMADIFRRIHERGGAAMQHRQRLRDGTSHKQQRSQATIQITQDRSLALDGETSPRAELGSNSIGV